MKIHRLYPFTTFGFIFLIMIFTNCQKEDYLATPDTATTKDIYSSLRNSIHELSLKNLAATTRDTRSDSDSCKYALDALLDKPEDLPASVESEEFDISSFEEFINLYGEDEFCELRESIDQYILCGAHNIEMIEDIIEYKNDGIKSSYYSICAYIDGISSPEFWNDWNREITYAEDKNEMNCRIAFRAKLTLIAISNGVNLSLGMIGLTIPGSAELIAVADLIGATSAAIDYFACVKLGVNK